MLALQELWWPFFVGGTELGRFKFFTLLLPLYTRLDKDEVENHDTRILILGYIIGNPGTHYTRIKKDLDLKNGTFEYHMRVLLRERKVKKRNHGGRVRFFPYSFTVGKITEYSEPTDKERVYLLYIKQETMATVKEIAAHFSIKKQSVYYIIKQMKEKGLVFYKEDGKIASQQIILTDKGKDEVEDFIKTKQL